MEYPYKKLTIGRYIDNLYKEGFQKSNLLENDVEEIFENIGIFRIKGYVKAFRKDASKYSLDDIINLYELDRKISINFFKISSQIEIKLKAYLIETVYSLTDNPFFYLVKNCYIDDFVLNTESTYDWETKKVQNRREEIYLHYRDYYLNKYDFNNNKYRYLKDIELIELNQQKEINYPPFHYFIENITLGSLINIISKLRIEENIILKLLANKFGMYDKDVFLNYLLRLKELRNRCAHNGRIFNRNFRGVKAYGVHKKFRKVIFEHKILDLYFSMQILLKNDTQINSIDKLLEHFKKDILNNCDNNLESFVMNIIKTR
ncbi:MAG: Abi family protein [Arcobacteraceae bacterium]|nr:Abi family protein [Arcobacteraceae bacterium]MDY0364685.1 Abi family protein [Arcobacteraceae bacterium]